MSLPVDQVDNTVLSPDEIKMEQMIAISPLVKSLLAQIDSLNKRVTFLETKLKGKI